MDDILTGTDLPDPATSNLTSRALREFLQLRIDVNRVMAGNEQASAQAAQDAIRLDKTLGTLRAAASGCLRDPGQRISATPSAPMSRPSSACRP